MTKDEVLADAALSFDQRAKKSRAEGAGTLMAHGATREEVAVHLTRFDQAAAEARADMLAKIGRFFDSFEDDPQTAPTTYSLQ